MQILLIHILQSYVSLTHKHVTHVVLLNEGITMCLKIDKYYTNVRQHNLFIP